MGSLEILQFGNAFCSSSILVRNARYRLNLWGENGSLGTELYDRKTDPEEMHNLANDPTQAKRIKQLTKQLDKCIAQANVVPENLERIPPPVRKRRNN